MARSRTPRKTAKNAVADAPAKDGNEPKRARGKKAKLVRRRSWFVT